jgi:hypothetical protein
MYEYTHTRRHTRTHREREREREREVHILSLTHNSHIRSNEKEHNTKKEQTPTQKDSALTHTHSNEGRALFRDKKKAQLTHTIAKKKSTAF